ncbi:hypothetical protein D3C73_1415680 [compost metagenome]
MLGVSLFEGYCSMDDKQDLGVGGDGLMTTSWVDTGDESLHWHVQVLNPTLDSDVCSKGGVDSSGMAIHGDGSR